MPRKASICKAAGWKNPRFLFFAAVGAVCPFGDNGREGGIAMIKKIITRLTSEQILMEAFKAHIVPAVLGECRLPDGKQLCR